MTESTDAGSAALRDVVEEFGRLLAIFEAQLGAAIVEADRECMAVGAAFHGLAAARDEISASVAGGDCATLVRRGCERIGASLTAATVALQYHDRLTQWVAHIRSGLQRLQIYLRDDSNRSHEQWLHTLKQVEHRYYLEQRRLKVLTQASNQMGIDSIAELF